MKITVTRKCPLTEVTKTREFDLPTGEVLMLYTGSKPIQEAAPSLTAEEREFIKTGIDGETWRKYVGGDDE